MEHSAAAPATASCNFSTRFDARLDAVSPAMAFLAQGLRRAGLAHDLVARSEMILEELMRNAVLHGYRGDSLRPVWIGIAGAAGAVQFWLEDEAPRFDPLTAFCAHEGRDLGAPAGQLEIGGVGLLLIRRLAARAAYSYRDGRNRVTVSW